MLGLVPATISLSATQCSRSFAQVNITMYTALRRLTLVFVMGLDYLIQVCQALVHCVLTRVVIEMPCPLSINEQKKTSSVAVRRSVAVMVVCVEHTMRQR